MSPAVALQRGTASAASGRAAVLARYRHLREISKQHHNGAMKFLPPDAILQTARRLGLAQGRTFVLDSMDELDLVFDLTIHTAPPGRTRAIDRYAKAARLPPDSEEARVLDAMCHAHFSVLRIERRHAQIGLIATDVTRETELWLVDVGLESSMPNGTELATRFFTPDSFSMTAGTPIPITAELVANVLADVPQLFRKSPDQVADDRRFAEAIYRAAVANGTMENVTFCDPPDD